MYPVDNVVYPAVNSIAYSTEVLETTRLPILHSLLESHPAEPLSLCSLEGFFGASSHVDCADLTFGEYPDMKRTGIF